MNQAGVRTEKLWFNFTPQRLFWAGFAGNNFTDRQRIKRKADNCARRYLGQGDLPRSEPGGTQTLSYKEGDHGSGAGHYAGKRANKSHLKVTSLALDRCFRSSGSYLELRIH